MIHYTRDEVIKAFEFLIDFNDSEEYKDNLAIVAFYAGELSDAYRRIKLVIDELEEIMNGKKDKEENR